ncbi:sperm flagellar protein 1-like isoform X7 [Nycticebus coucang]|uniref:sperm flagellar protein 1-like isoform X7 n=1 Tax=Nycticebus coucang TaxID=9470 RepID=UPI00234C9075|nr:sperm flagellar protein 1-like isoform X7 [Nycticebus coucang]
MLGTAGQTPGALSLPPPGTLRGLYAWLDRLPLSRPKRHLARDFSDGVMLAEIVKHFHPRLVDLHNYTPTCNTDQKLSNWHVLNRKVLHKLSFYVSETDIRKVVANRPGAIEPILCALREKIESGAAHIDLRAATSAGSGPFGVDTLQPQVDLATNTHTGRPRSMALSSRKTTQDGSAPGKLGHCACGGWDPAGGPWEHPDPRTQQLLEEQEQALAVLQEMVKILQMKVVRLEHLVQLKDRQIAELTRPRREEHRGPPGGAP